MLKHNTIFLIVGKSGSGKDTIADRLASRYGVSRLYSFTTRPCRGPDDNHLFEDNYQIWLANNPGDEIVGYTKFNGYDYWATASLVESADLYIIDPAGVAFMKEHYTGSKKIKVVYVDVPDSIRLDRMCNRGDGLAKAAERLLYDSTAFAGAIDEADFVIHNDDLSACVDELWEYMKREDGTFV